MKFDLQKVFGQIMHTKRLVIILLIGMGLLFLPGLFKQSPSKSQEPAQKQAEINHYGAELEKRLCNILSTVRGVSRVQVMITLTDNGETYYAQNERSDEHNTSDGALREDERQADGSLALKNDAGGGQSPVVLKTVLPKVSGVLVTAQGVEDQAVRAEVIRAVCAVLDVPSHRVQVLEKG